MDIYTLNVGQGQFVVVVGNNDAVIVDSSIPLQPKHPIVNVKAALAKILHEKKLIGLVITGFDADHFNEVGLKIILNKYRPQWAMYPKYYKDTTTTRDGFKVFDKFSQDNNIKRHPIKLNDNNKRFYSNLSIDFKFEVFSPHQDDMDSSNNCSLVCKIIEKSTNKTYLVTGDTEKDRWDRIVEIFDTDIKCDVLSAPHHGSKNGITSGAMRLMNPHTVLISAGVDNSYGHPDPEAKTIFFSETKNVYSTSDDNGQSILTEATNNGIVSYIFNP